MSENPAFEAWLKGLSEGWWDDAADAGGILGSLQDAFEAGQGRVSLDVTEALIALDAVMVFYKKVEEVTGNSGLELPAIEALQHKLERALKD
jgi:hypothetical protein